MAALPIHRYFDYKKTNVLTIGFHDLRLHFLCDDRRLLDPIALHFIYYDARAKTKKARSAHCIMNIVHKGEFNRFRRMFKKERSFEAFPGVTVSTGQLDHYYVYHIHASYFVIMDNRTNDCACLILESAERTMIGIEYLIHILMLEWLRGLGYFLIHASGVSHRKRGILFIGPPGCGKTTAALTAVTRGLSLLGDDQILLKREKQTIMAYSFMNKVKLNLDGIKRFQEFAMRNLKPLLQENGKSIKFSVEDYFTVRREHRAPVRTIYFLKKTDSLERLTLSAALPLLMSNSFFYSRKEASIKHFEVLCLLLANAKAYTAGFNAVNGDWKSLLRS